MKKPPTQVALVRPTCLTSTGRKTIYVALNTKHYVLRFPSETS